MSDLVPEGYYDAKAVQWGVQETKNGGFRFALTFEIQRGAFEGQKVYGSYSLDNPDWYQKCLAALALMGMEGDDIEAIPSLPNTVNILVKHRTYNGRTFADVKGVYEVKRKGPAGTGKLPSELAAELRNRIRAMRGEAPIAAPSQPVQSPMDDSFGEPYDGQF